MIPVVLSEAKDLAVMRSVATALGVASTGIQSNDHRKVLRFAQDDRVRPKHLPGQGKRP